MNYTNYAFALAIVNREEDRGFGYREVIRDETVFHHIDLGFIAVGWWKE